MLTEKAIRALKAKEKLYRVSDGQVPGLSLEVAPNGSKRWRLRFMQNGKANMLSLGLYPEVTLADARDRALETRKSIRSGEAAVVIKKTRAGDEWRFSEVASKWLTVARQENIWADITHEQNMRNLEYASRIGGLGDMPVKSITSREVLNAARRLEANTAPVTARRVLALVLRVMHYALRMGMIETVPQFKVQDSLGKPPAVVHRYALTNPKDIPDLLEYIDSHSTVSTRRFLQVMALFFCRSSELRFARWEDIDWENKLYRIPAERMKMRREHLIPLSRQAIALLEAQKELTGEYDFIFCARPNKPLSSTTPESVLKARFRGRMTVHGFRSMASTLLNERGWNPDVIEAQLAHQDANAVRRAYNRAQYLEDRRRMMQEWADYLDELRAKN